MLIRGYMILFSKTDILAVACIASLLLMCLLLLLLLLALCTAVFHMNVQRKYKCLATGLLHSTVD
jgi:hypothetical protein